MRICRTPIHNDVHIKCTAGITEFVDPTKALVKNFAGRTGLRVKGTGYVATIRHSAGSFQWRFFIVERPDVLALAAIETRWPHLPCFEFSDRFLQCLPLRNGPSICSQVSANSQQCQRSFISECTTVLNAHITAIPVFVGRDEAARLFFYGRSRPRLYFSSRSSDDGDGHV